MTKNLMGEQHRRLLHGYSEFPLRRTRRKGSSVQKNSIRGISQLSTRYRPNGDFGGRYLVLHAITYHREKNYAPSMAYFDELERVSLEHNSRARRCGLASVYRGEIHWTRQNYEKVCKMQGRLSNLKVGGGQAKLKNRSHSQCSFRLPRTWCRIAQYQGPCLESWGGRLAPPAPLLRRP